MVNTVQSIVQLQNFAGASNTIIVKDNDDGSVFNFTTDALTADGINIIEATGKGDGFWIRFNTSNFKNNGDGTSPYATIKYVDDNKNTPYNGSFVELLENNSNIGNSYFIKLNSGDTVMGLGVIINGEAVQYNFIIDQDGFMRMSNMYSNTLTGDVMNTSGAALLTTGILEFAIRAKKSGASETWDWIPNHNISTTGATLSVDRKIYVDGVLTDITSFATNDTFVFNQFTIIQEYTGYSTFDVAHANPLFDCVTTHTFKDGKMTISNNLIALDNVTMYDGYSGKITATDPNTNKMKFDNEFIVIAAGSNGYFPYNYPVKSVGCFSDSGKYAMAVECSSLAESTSYGKNYADQDGNKILWWDRANLSSSFYWLWTPRDTQVEVPTGTKFTSKNTIIISTNVNKVIR